MKVTLLDSLNKRVRFLEEVCERLDLENVTCVHARAEDGAEIRITGRNLTCAYPVQWQIFPLYQNICMPFVRVGGYFVPYKSGEIVEELAKYAGVPVWNGLTNEDHPTRC